MILMKDLVSVIIPVYNTGVILKDCINSILNNDYQNIEILLIDDGSEKETAELCNCISKSDIRIKVVHQDNGGVSSARNTGIEYAKGNYIMFVDADDQIATNLINTLLEECNKNKADIALCGHKECYGGGKYIEKNCAGSIEIKKEKEILKEFFGSNKIGWNVWGKLYKKEVVGNTRFLIGKKTAEDMFFVYEVLKKAKKIVIGKEPLYYYIKNNDSAMADVNCNKFFDTYDLINKVYEDEFIDVEMQMYKTEFYINSSLWFFKFIIAKDKEKRYRKRIENLRIQFLNNVENNGIESSTKTRFLINIFKHNYGLFKILARFWGYKVKI